jgi:hypothetical protein
MKTRARVSSLRLSKPVGLKHCAVARVARHCVETERENPGVSLQQIEESS